MRIICFFAFFTIALTGKCQKVLGLEWTSEKVATVLIKNIENNLLDPIIKLNSNDKLRLSFDTFGNTETNYMYSFTHCDSEWKKSDLLPSEYIEGFPENYIENYSLSFNTINNYVHYECVFPNENINFLLSGNYILRVWDPNTMNEIFRRRVVVYENIVEIKASVKRATFSEDRLSKQEIDFEIHHFNIDLKDPQNEIKVVIQQNDNWENTKNNINPTFIKRGILEYDYDQEISFDGGSEFNNFDIRSLRFFSQNIDTIHLKKIQIEKERPKYSYNTYYQLNESCNWTSETSVYLVELKQDERKESKSYFEKYDLNGKRIISKDNSYSPENESEYTLVKFNLARNKFNKEEKIYIFGALSNWKINSNFLLEYNSKKNSFEKEILLKQGYYNYQYVTKKSCTGCIYSIDGNYYETNNEYTIYVYHKSPWERYERLVGIEKITSNSLN